MIITGYYNERGYQVESDNPMDAILYHAGKHALESVDWRGTRHRLPLTTIKAFCLQTTLELVAEHGAKYAGVQYLEED